MKKNRRVVLTERLNIPGEGVAGQARITMTGARILRVENHRGILDYSAELIAINCGDTVVTVTGVKLELTSMSAGELLIRGDVKNVEFS